MIQLPTNVKQAELLKSGMREFASEQMAIWADQRKTAPFLRDFLKTIYRLACLSHCDRMQDVLTLARNGDAIADDVLCQLYREMKSSSVSPPVMLDVYVTMEVSRRSEGWRFKKRKGKKKTDQIMRNIGIVHTMAALIDVYGLHPTKGSDWTIAASEIVGEILKPPVGYKAIEEVWRNWSGVAPTRPGFWAT